MNTFTRIIWGLSIAGFIGISILLILALTKTLPDNPLKEFRIMIGFGFILFAQINLKFYKDYRKNKTIH